MNNFLSCIYTGFVTHKRFKPKKHFFSYKTFSLLIDLNEIEKLDKNIKFFSYNKFNILSFYNIDHGPRDGSSLIKWVKKTLIKRKINISGGRVKLLCYPRFFGYVFNPLSIFYCYDKNLKLKTILYEVKNTFNEQHTYIFPVKKSSDIVLQKCEKKFYVSPFIEMKTFYNFRLSQPKEKIKILIRQNDVNGPLLLAHQEGTKIKLNSQNLLIEFLKHPFMSFKIIMAIHFEAFRLWVKGVNLVKKKIKIKNSLSLEN
tara:strand:+ start:200 stop:970 length:771 start_codon:yes stop_codon:yes gene_type:complete